MPSANARTWRLWTVFLALVFCACGVVAATPVMLADAVQTLENPPVQFWQDESGKAGLDQVRALPPGRFAVADSDAVHRLGGKRNLWLYLRVTRQADSRMDWRLSFPSPVLDAVSVFQQDATGKWREESAGDTIANIRWPEGGRYPYFRLDVVPGQTRDIYIRIRHVTPVSVPVRITSEPAHDQRMQIEYLALGMMFGAMLLLIVACLAQSFVYRESAYAWYAIYSLILTLAVAAYTGVAGHLIWPQWDSLADSAQVFLALLASAAALLFVRHLCGISGRFARLDKVVLVVGLAGMAASVAVIWLPRETWGVLVLSIGMGVCIALCLLVAVLTWLRGDLVGRWVLLANVPISTATCLALLRLLGAVPASWLTQYGVVAAMALEVPLLLVALSIRLRERHGAETRAHALSTQDALTGLLSEHLFRDRLRQVVSRAKRDKESAAVVLIDLVNHASIRRSHGPAVAEQSLLRTVIKLRRVLRDVDTTSRVGEARFGLILEGASTRSAVTERAAQLIALGLMPLKGLKPEVTLQFHVAAVLLQERLEDAHTLMENLSSLLADMSPRTRRPIRFLESALSGPMPLKAMDSLDGDTRGSGHTSSLPDPR